MPDSPPTGDRQLPHQRNLRAGRWSEALGCYAITKNVDRRQPVLVSPEAADLLLSSMMYLRKVSRVRLLGFCIMPDHYHMLFFLLAGASLKGVMESIGKYTALRMNRLLRRTGRFWQEGYHDHRCRDEDDIQDRLIYIEHNPVRAGLVRQAEQWLYSSAHPSRKHMLDRGWYAEVQ